MRAQDGRDRDRPGRRRVRRRSAAGGDLPRQRVGYAARRGRPRVGRGGCAPMLRAGGRGYLRAAFDNAR